MNHYEPLHGRTQTENKFKAERDKEARRLRFIVSRFS
jgi:hypothetical protein